MKKAKIDLSFQDYEGCDYEQFWSGPGKEYLDRLERRIVTHTLPGGNAVVEIGAGFGRLGGCYVGRYHSVHMVEPASNLRAAAAQTYGDAVTYHDASVYDLPFSDASFDAVLMVRVFHHLGSSEAALKELYRIIKPEGVLVFNYSNKRNIKRILKFITGKGANPFNCDVEPYYSSLFGYHPSYIDDLLTTIGFGIKEQYGVGIVDKVINLFPSLSKLASPSLFFSRLLGHLKIAPAQFVVAVKK